jgi:UDP-glucose 4-epimerase
MNALVAGAAGFIGSHLVDALLNLGHNVIGVDNYLLGKKENIAHLDNDTRFTMFDQDICDIDGLQSVFAANSIDYVFHLAANSDIQAGGRDPNVDLKNTYLTTFNLLECMRQYNVKKLFFSSTSAVYGEKDGESMSENDGPLNPVSYYGATKLGSEALISVSSALHDISALVFRFPNVVGTRLTHGVIYDFIKKLQNNSQVLEILGDGKQTKPYLYVDDLINGILQFMDAPSGLTVYNIGGESQTNVTRIADIVCAGMGLKDVRYEYTGGRGGWPGDVPEFAYDLSKIHAEGWRAKYTSDEAVAKTVEELCKLL